MSPTRVRKLALSCSIAIACCLTACAIAHAQRPEELPPPMSSGVPQVPAFDQPGIQPGAMQPGGARPLVIDTIVQGGANEDRVRSYIRTKKEYEYDPVTLQSDVRRLISSGEFRTVKTYTRAVAEGVVVIFDVTERPRVNYIEFLGNRGFADKKLSKTINMKVGEPLNTYEVEEGRRRIEEHYRSKGYPRAQVSILEGNKPDDRGVAYIVSEGYLQRIEAVTFEGNLFASDGVLRTKIESKPGYFWYLIRGKFDRAKLDADVEKITAYYRDFGFFRARVGRQLEFDHEGKWVSIRFIIDEGQRYNVRNVSIVGAETFRTEPIIDSLTLKSQKPFNRPQMQKDLTLLRDLYGSQGRIFADVQAEPRYLEEPGQIDLVYKIQEGEPFHVGEVHVHIAGEFPHTRRNVVLNRLSLRPGDLIDIREIRDSERRLKASQLFETEQTGGEPPKIVVRPPELSGAKLAGVAPNGNYRGQSPAVDLKPVPGSYYASRSVQRLPPPQYDVDVFLPASPQERPAPPQSYRLGNGGQWENVRDEIRPLPPID